MRFNVWVNQGSTLRLRTIVGAERGANAAAEAGKRAIGMLLVAQAGERKVAM